MNGKFISENEWSRIERDNFRKSVSVVVENDEQVFEVADLLKLAGEYFVLGFYVNQVRPETMCVWKKFQSSPWTHTTLYERDLWFSESEPLNRCKLSIDEFKERLECLS